LSFYHPFFIIYGLLLVLLIYIVFKFTAQRGLDTSLEESKMKYKVAHWIQEIARSIISFKLSGKTSQAIQKNDALVAEYLDARESHFRILVLQFIQMIGFKVLVTAGLLLIGGLLVLDQEMNIGQFVAAEIIILLVISSVEKMILGLETFYDLLTSLEKLGQVVDKELEPQEGETPFAGKDGLTIELQNLVYNVPGRDKRIIDNVSLMIPPGTRMLIQGSNGSGRATLLRLIAGVIEPDHGNIFVNNVAISGVNLREYRSLLGHALTEEYPFEGTILDNITFGNTEISMEDVYWALEMVGLTQFVKEQPLGLKTMLYPEGKKIPDFISKKIVLARSIVIRPKLMILKDPLDQFDEVETERMMDFLADPTNGWALVVVSENPKWVSRCDTVVRMENGRLIQKN
ncbi:MAG: ATP-binding cassette domain-containing protein, partial [Bacteroidota bacterium]|nr:ATP-binding cassette domain-containing protein [Bacteroidota bacterium]